MPADVMIKHDTLETSDTVDANRNINICLRTYHFLEAKSPRIPTPTYMNPHHSPEADIFTS